MSHKKDFVYLDYVTTTPLNPEVYTTYCELLKNSFANSDSIYQMGKEVEKLQEQARKQIIQLLHGKHAEVIFTSGASEANNLAIKGIAFSNLNGNKHIVTTQIEHSSVLHTIQQLEKLFGFEVTYLPVDERGIVSLEQLKEAVRKDTCLVSIMAVNNEIGSIQPIQEIGTYLQKNSQAVFHVDAVQIIGKLSLDSSMIDLLTISAHKLYGLKGSGVLIKKQHIQLEPVIVAGQQEKGLRGGTSNALVNIMFAKTLRLAMENQENHYHLVTEFYQYLRTQLEAVKEVTILSPDLPDSSPYLLNFSCQGLTSEVLMNALDNKGIAVSARSTCSSHSKDDSYVLIAMGIGERKRKGAIRVSLSHLTKKEELDYFMKELKEIIKRYAIKNI